jgi:hypothetical protein
MHNMHRLDCLDIGRALTQRDARHAALVVGNAFAAHPRADETTFPAGVNRTRVSEMRFNRSDVTRRACIPRGRRWSHVGSSRERNGNGQAPRPTG